MTGDTIEKAASADWASGLARARMHAPFLADALDKLPGLASLLAAGALDDALTQAKAAGQGEGEAGAALRRERLALALTLGVADLAGALPLSTVMHELSAFADRALDTAIRDAVAQRTPAAEFGGVTGIALGKQGAQELNVFIGHRPDPAFRSHHSAAPPPRGSRRGRTTHRAHGGADALRAHRTRLCVPRRSAAAAGLGNQPAGDLAARRDQSL